MVVCDQMSLDCLSSLEGVRAISCLIMYNDLYAPTKARWDNFLLLESVCVMLCLCFFLINQLLQLITIPI